MVPHVPIIPLGLWATEKVWPRNSKVPHVWNVADPPVITVCVGAPVGRLRRAGAKGRPADPYGDTAKVMKAIMALLPEESRVLSEVTEADLVKTRPS